MKHKLFLLMAMLLIGVTGLAAQNYSLVLDGTQDCVNVGDLTDLVTNVYTVEAWINPAVTNVRKEQARYKDPASRPVRGPAADQKQ